MPDTPSLRFPLATLQREGAYLLHAYAAHRVELDVRLGEGYLPAATTVHEALFGPLNSPEDVEDATATPNAKAKSKTNAATAVTPPESALAQQASAAAQAGNLTREQNAALDDLTELMAGARATARRAFKGQSVKLHDDYQVGDHDSRTLADVLQRAAIILASCRRDAAALQAAGGWTLADTTALENALHTTGGADTAQVEAQGAALGATGDKSAQANAYFETLLRLQNAANLQWPARKPANRAIRHDFRLGIFPPRLAKKPTAPETPTTGPSPVPSQP